MFISKCIIKFNKNVLFLAVLKYDKPIEYI